MKRQRGGGVKRRGWFAHKRLETQETKREKREKERLHHLGKKIRPLTNYKQRGNVFSSNEKGQMCCLMHWKISNMG